MYFPNKTNINTHEQIYAYTFTVGPSNWNKLPQSLGVPFPMSFDRVRKHLKTSLLVSDDNE